MALRTLVDVALGKHAGGEGKVAAITGRQLLAVGGHTRQRVGEVVLRVGAAKFIVAQGRSDLGGHAAVDRPLAAQCLGQLLDIQRMLGELPDSFQPVLKLREGPRNLVPYGRQDEFPSVF